VTASVGSTNVTMLERRCRWWQRSDEPHTVYVPLTVWGTSPIVLAVPTPEELERGVARTHKLSPYEVVVIPAADPGQPDQAIGAYSQRLEPKADEWITGEESGVAVPQPYLGWIAYGLLTVEHGHLTIATMRLATLGERRDGVTSVLIRRVRVDAILQAARERLVDTTFGDLAGGDWAHQAHAVKEAMHGVELKRGREGYPADHYRKIALRALQLQAEHGARGVRQRLAEAEGRPPETVRDWIKRARQLGYLAPATPGRAGYVPGPNLEPGDDS
jgi:hypothetical protein